MKSNIKNKQGGLASTKQGGFLQIIIFIVIALLLMKFFDVTFSDVVTWFKTFFGNILK